MTGRLPFDPVEEAHRQWVDHGWVDAADGMAAVTSVMRAHQLLLGRIDEELRPLGLTFARYELLMLLTFSRAGALPLAKLGARLQVHPTSVTSAVDRLEAQGFVQRRPHPTDRRATLAEITDSGRAVAAAATERLNARVFADVGVPDEDLGRLVGVLRGLRERAGDF
ncbi:MAG: MarR family transcriptional regulator [Candidatus Nanopelagicales bacterium]